MVYLTVHSFVVYIWSSSLILNIRIAEAKCNTVLVRRYVRDV